MKRHLTILLLLAGVLAFDMNGQDVTYGFRAGLTRSIIDGPSELDAEGNELESYDYNTGFHIGAGARIPFNDLIGLRTEVVYSQKGAKYTYNGQSVRLFRTEAGTQIPFTGVSDVSLEVNLSYLEIPVMVYARFWDIIEISAGLHAGIRVASTGGGRWTFEGTNNTGFDLETTTNLDYSWTSDEPGEFVTENVTTVNIGGSVVQLPETIGAYYNFNEDPGNPWRSLEFGADAGISFLLNQGLALGVRVQYGFSDISNEEADYARFETNGTEFIYRDDQDQNFAWQFSVGFNF